MAIIFEEGEQSAHRLKYTFGRSELADFPLFDLASLSLAYTLT